MKKILLIGLLIFPLFAFADVPAFPMSFWGTVTINGASAPVGTVVRAYYGTSLAGEATVTEVGIYGYTEPTKQKLVIGEGDEPITFKIQSAAHNGGVETAGIPTVASSSFVSGSTEEMNFAFTITAPVVPPSGGGGGGGGRSSGGGGGTTLVSPIIAGEVLGASIDLSTKEAQINLITKQLVVLLTQLILLLQAEILQLQSVN